jgi:hypothetical protein
MYYFRVKPVCLTILILLWHFDSAGSVLGNLCTG